MAYTTRMFSLVLTICIAVLSSVDAAELRGTNYYKRELHPRTRQRQQMNELKMASAPRSAPQPLASPPDIPRDTDSDPIVKVQRVKVAGGMNMMKKRGGHGTRTAMTGMMMHGGAKTIRKRKQSTNPPGENEESVIEAEENNETDVETFDELAPEGDEIRVTPQSESPSDSPSPAPSLAPTSTPSEAPTDAPTYYPTDNPTANLSSSGTLTWPPTTTFYPTSKLTSDE